MSKERIDNFGGWEDASQQHDFFGEVHLATEDVDKTSTTDPKDKNDPKEEPSKKAGEPSKKNPEEDDDDEAQKKFNPFSDNIDDEDEDEDDDTPKGKGSSSKDSAKLSNKSTLEFLKEKGLVDYELEEGQELTEDEAENMLEDSWEAAVEKGIEESIQDLPQAVKDLIQIASKGGDVTGALKKLAVAATAPINSKSDIAEESVQIKALELDYANKGFTPEEIQEHIEVLKEKGKLAEMGGKAFERVIKSQETAAQQEAITAKNDADNRKKNAREYKSNISSHINSLEEVRGLPLSKADKTTLPGYIAEPTVELQDGRLISEFQADIFKIMADKDKITLLAKLVKSDFDFSSIERKQKTAKAREVRQTLDNTAEGKTGKGSGSRTRKPIWDMID